MSALNKVANVVQKGVVTGLFSVFAWQVWQIGVQCTEHQKMKRIERRSDHAIIMDAITEKVREESEPHSVGTIPDRYDPDDDSYMKKVPNLAGAIRK